MSTDSKTPFMPYGAINITCCYGDLHILTRIASERAPAFAETQTTAPPQRSVSAAPEPPSLSPRQWQVLRLLVLGRSNKEIARSLGIAMGTVKIHTAILFSKMGVTSRTAAAVAGAKLLTLQDRSGASRSEGDLTAGPRFKNLGQQPYCPSWAEPA